MPNDQIIDPSDLSHLPGAPFSFEEVEAATVALRAAAGWHIAPVRTETIRLDVTQFERWLRLPTLHLVSVGAIRNAKTGVVIDATRYSVSRRLAQVKRNSYWPSGYEAVEVDMTHGYVTMPLDLLTVVAEATRLARRDQSTRSVQIDDFQQSFGQIAAGPTGTADTLRRYSLADQSLGGIGVA